MKKLKQIVSIGSALVFLNTSPAYAQIGDMGFFGGTSEGTRLLKTTETLLIQSGTAKKTTNVTPLVYKEVVFLSGSPVEVEGLLTVRSSGGIKAGTTIGYYTETYTIKPSSTSSENSVDRTIRFNVNYRIEGNQTIKDYKVTSWNESIAVGGERYVVDSGQSDYGLSIIEDKTAGVTYYKGNISQHAVYIKSGEEAEEDIDATTLDTSGTIYGYTSAWSSTETHRIDGFVSNSNEQIQYQVRPSVSVNKILQYSENEPTAMSFSGNYREVMQNTSGLQYDIFVKPLSMYNVPNKGSVNIPSYNSFEQLIAPNVNFLKGHFAEGDIKKLFSMQILDGEPRFYQPSQAMTRGQYVAALAKAIKLPIDTTKKTNTKKTTTVNIVFPDVREDRAEYPYIMAAYRAGLATGRSNGNFATDSPIERQEAIVMLIRALGLSNLGLDSTPATGFTDEYKIADWAKKELYAANRLGIIRGDQDGNIRPTDIITKADAAAFINRMIDYMRSDMTKDYMDHIVNYPK